MTTTPRHPLVEEYLTELRQRAKHLPRHEREELLAELRAHVDAGAEQAESEADIHNMLEALGAPEEIIAAAPAATHTGPTGRLGLTFGIVALVTVPTPFLGILTIPLGIAAVVLGVRARRFLRSSARLTSIATAAIVTGGSAVVMTLVLFAFLVSARSSGQQGGVVVETSVSVTNPGDR